MSNVSAAEQIKIVYQGYAEGHASVERWNPSNPGNQAILRERRGCTRALLQHYSFLPLARRRVLDVGCGSGSELAHFMEWGASSENLYGVDLLPKQIARARQCFPEIYFLQGNAEQLGFQSATFDLVLLFTVFTSILDAEMARNVAEEVGRVLKPGGAIVWYDFRYDNPRNRHVHGMTRTDIRTLFPGFDHCLHTITLLPPMARRLGRATPLLYPLLSRVPFLRTHYIGLLVKP